MVSLDGAGFWRFGALLVVGGLAGQFHRANLVVFLPGAVEKRHRSEAATSMSADGAVAWEDLGSAACSAVARGAAGLGLRDTGNTGSRFPVLVEPKHKTHFYKKCLSLY